MTDPNKTLKQIADTIGPDGVAALTASSAKSDLLHACVMEHVTSGCHGMDDSLGIQKMPEGYALMLNADESHFYWLRYDGVESQICWDKWAVYRGAKEDAAKGM